MYTLRKITTSFLVLICLVLSKPLASQHLHPAINFDYTGLCYGNITFFTNTTVSSPPATYTWTIFRQGFAVPVYTNTSTNISYLFPAKDTYTVLLCADNGGGHQDCMGQVIQMDSLLHADFQYQDCESKFSSFSPCATSQKWDFGDGNTSTLKNPTHYYTNTGSYNVKLVVSNGTQSDSITKSIFSYTNAVTGGFTYKHLTHDSVFFMAHDTLLGGNVTYHWIFGDGEEAEVFSFPGMKVKHKYPAIKKDTTYKAFLHVEVFCNEWETEQDIFIADSVRANTTLIFPNPSSHLIYIETERKSELTDIKLFDVLGQEIKGLNAMENLRGYTIDVRNLAKATFVLRLYYGKDDVKTYKVIVN